MEMLGEPPKRPAQILQHIPQLQAKYISPSCGFPEHAGYCYLHVLSPLLDCGSLHMGRQVLFILYPHSALQSVGTQLTIDWARNWRCHLFLNEGLAQPQVMEGCADTGRN